MEREIMETVLQEMLQELRNQKKQLTSLHTGLEGQGKIIAGIAGQYTPNVNDNLPVALSDEQLLHLKGHVEQQFEALRMELLKRPCTSYTVKHFSLLPPSFRMEYFPLVVNTVMKWVVWIAVLIFIMRMIKSLMI